MRAWLTHPHTSPEPKAAMALKISFCCTGNVSRNIPSPSKPTEWMHSRAALNCKDLLNRRLPPSNWNSLYCPERLSSPLQGQAGQPTSAFLPEIYQVPKAGSSWSFVRVAGKKGQPQTLQSGSYREKTDQRKKCGQWETLIIAWHEHIQPPTRTKKRWE